MNTPLLTKLIGFLSTLKSLAISWYSKINFRLLTAEEIYLFLKFFFIPAIVILLSLITVVIIYRRFRLDAIELQKSELDDTVNNFLTDIIFLDYTDEETLQKIQHFQVEYVKNNPKIERFILNKLIRIKRNVQQLNQEKFIFIYESFGFRKITDKLINSYSWTKKSQGFYHYQILDHKEKQPLIAPYLDHNNGKIRSNALIAMISLSTDNFDILNDYRHAISEADELKILDVIYQKETVIPANISKWLRNKNESIVSLAIKLGVHFNYDFTEIETNHILKTYSSAIRREIILALRALSIEAAVEPLIAHYNHESNLRNKISILKTFQKINNDNTKELALGLLFTEKNIDLKFEIVNCIHQIDQTFFQKFKTNDQQEHELINRMLLHHSNAYLN